MRRLRGGASRRSSSFPRSQPTVVRRAFALPALTALASSRCTGHSRPSRSFASEQRDIARMIEIPTASKSSPLVIGATGGSGTRVVARIARQAGYDLGSHLNGAEDALEFIPFHDRWINRMLAADGAPLTARESEDIALQFRGVLDCHLPRHSEAGQRWGWKAPRSIYFLPLFHRLYPDVKFIHVLRDGRDMAFSKNQNQLRQHGSAVLNWRERWFAAAPVRSIMLWERINLRAASFGESQLGGNYLAVRFEDLCREPTSTVARLLKFLESNLDPQVIANAEISPPGTLSRWKSEPESITGKLTAIAERSLRKFGYLVDTSVEGGRAARVPTCPPVPHRQ